MEQLPLLSANLRDALKSPTKLLRLCKIAMSKNTEDVLINPDDLDNYWVYPVVHIDDDVVTIKLDGENIQEWVSMHIYCEVTDIKPNEDSTIELMFSLDVKGFEEYGEDYIQLDFREINDLRCKWDVFDNTKGSDVPLKKYVRESDHSHWENDESSENKFINMVKILSEDFAEINENKEIFIEKPSSAPDCVYLDKAGDIYSSGGKIVVPTTEYKEKDFVKKTGVAELFSNDSIHTDFGLIKIK